MAVGSAVLKLKLKLNLMSDDFLKYNYKTSSQVCLSFSRAPNSPTKARYRGYSLSNYEHSEQARAPHTNGPRAVPRCGALSLLQKTLHYKGGMMVMLMPLFAAALVVRRRYFIVAPRPFPAAPLVASRCCRRRSQQLVCACGS